MPFSQDTQIISQLLLGGRKKKAEMAKHCQRRRAPRWCAQHDVYVRQENQQLTRELDAASLLLCVTRLLSHHWLGSPFGDKKSSFAETFCEGLVCCSGAAVFNLKHRCLTGLIPNDPGAGPGPGTEAWGIPELKG